MQLAHLLWALTLDQEQGKVMCAVAPDIEGNLEAFLCAGAHQQQVCLF